MSHLKHIVVPDRALPLAHVSIVTRSGSLLDPKGKEGTTRLLFRLMRRSVTGLTTEELDEKLDLLGGTLGGDVSRSVAGFHGGVLSRSKDEFFNVTARILSAPAFEESEFERLKSESLAEWEDSLDSDSTLVQRAFTRNLFAGHPYSRLAGGTPKSLENITLDDLKQCYQKLFCRDSLLFSLAGDVTDEMANALADQVNRALPKDDPAVPVLNEPVVPSGRRLIFVDKPERTQTQILIGGLGTHPSDHDHTALFVGHTIFGGTFSARLSLEVRGKRGWSYGASSSLPLDRKRQAFSMWTFPQASDAAACIRLQLSLLEKLIEKGVTLAELKAAKKYLSNSHVFSVDTAAKRAALALDEKSYNLSEGYYRDHVARVQALSLEEVNAALTRRLSAKNLLIAILGTKNELLSEVQDSIEGLQGSEVLAFNQRD